MRGLMIAVLACAAVAAWALPPRVENAERAQQSTIASTGFQLELERARKAAIDANEVRKRLIWLDNMERVAAQTDAPVVVGVDFQVSEDLLREVETSVREGVNAAELKTRVGFFVQHANAASRTRRYGGASLSNEYYVGANDGGGFCYKLVGVRETRAVERLETTPKHLGACALYGSFGMPGAGVAEWMASGGVLYAAETGYSSEVFGLRTLFGVRGREGGHLYNRSFEVEACAAGAVEACEGLFLQPLAPRASRRSIPVATFTEANAYEAALNEPALHHLRDEFGDERFAQFWTSEQGVSEAFESAFGVTVSEWTMAYVQARYGALERGPRIAGFDAFGAVVFALLATLWALYAARRRAGPARDEPVAA